MGGIAGNLTGTNEQLVVLKGTIPTYHRGATYQTPINLCIPYNYPVSPPVVVVKPTASEILYRGACVVRRNCTYSPHPPALTFGDAEGCVVNFKN